MSNRRSFVVSLVAAIAAVVVLALPGRASAGPGDPAQPPKPGALVVTVCTPNGVAVPGAHVEVRHLDRVVAAGETNREGKFFVPRLHPGRFGVFAGKRPVGSGRAVAEVVSEKRAEAKITLKK